MNRNKPNVLLITVDQMRYDCLSIAGHPVVETPNLDELARTGVRFDRAYSATPSCIPARAAIFTGKSQTGHGRVGYQDRVPWRYDRTMPEEFAKAGYHTQCVGKMHVYPARNLMGFHHVVLHDGYLHHNRNKYSIPVSEHYDEVDDYLHWLRQAGTRRGPDRFRIGLQRFGGGPPVASSGKVPPDELGRHRIDRFPAPPRPGQAVFLVDVFRPAPFAAGSAAGVSRFVRRRGNPRSAESAIGR